jgi:hypothetical protein
VLRGWVSGRVGESDRFSRKENEEEGGFLGMLNWGLRMGGVEGKEGSFGVGT